MEHPYTDAVRFEKVALTDGRGGYDWCIAGVWRDKTTGRLYGDADEGCSCNGPFEDSKELGDLKEIVHEREGAALLDDLYDAPTTEERLDFCHKVREALRA